MKKRDQEKLASLILKSKGMLATNTSQKMTYDEMGTISDFGGINFHKWANGTNTPKSVIGVLNLLSSLNNQQIIQLMDMWRDENLLPYSSSD
ncbi:hypothetical protein CIG1485E_a0102 (plasmid) [Campylobacter iguaniorum]|uniref:Uncharacterized protein n=1 Tax=Campylobacter iguaniorum TaxID=1244531 RepID=A0A076FDY9_9BACT|nr:hypothetical protein [Campylobacter iguaniorum]AII15627.1 hypothetical protein CIG1485E_a0102 [Campylobacter iguaniorum]